MLLILVWIRRADWPTSLRMRVSSEGSVLLLFVQGDWDKDDEDGAVVIDPSVPYWQADVALRTSDALGEDLSIAFLAVEALLVAMTQIRGNVNPEGLREAHAAFVETFNVNAPPGVRATFDTV